MISIQSLTQRYGSRTALDALDLEIAPGEVFCLLGPNGAGKSTTIRILAGFQAPTRGRASIAGADVTTQSDTARAATAYVPEIVALYPQLSGLENLEYFAQLALGRTLERSRSLELLEAAGLERAAAERRVATYSKGMRQKVALALASAKGARALLFDEPTSGLDPRAANDFAQHVRALAAQGSAVLMATHDLPLALEAGGRVGILVNGRLVEERRTSGLAQNELAALYLAHVRA